MVGHADERVISVGRVVSHAATYKTTVVGRTIFSVRTGGPGLVLHYVVVA
jgi:hypothetical protein